MRHRLIMEIEWDESDNEWMQPEADALLDYVMEWTGERCDRPGDGYDDHVSFSSTSRIFDDEAGDFAFAWQTYPEFSGLPMASPEVFDRLAADDDEDVDDVSPNLLEAARKLSQFVQTAQKLDQQRKDKP